MKCLLEFIEGPTYMMEEFSSNMKKTLQLLNTPSYVIMKKLTNQELVSYGIVQNETKGFSKGSKIPIFECSLTKNCPIWDCDVCKEKCPVCRP